MNIQDTSTPALIGSSMDFSSHSDADSFWDGVQPQDAGWAEASLNDICGASTKRETQHQSLSFSLRQSLLLDREELSKINIDLDRHRHSDCQHRLWKSPFELEEEVEKRCVPERAHSSSKLSSPFGGESEAEAKAGSLTINARLTPARAQSSSTLSSEVPNKATRRSAPEKNRKNARGRSKSNRSLTPEPGNSSKRSLNASKARSQSASRKQKKRTQHKTASIEGETNNRGSMVELTSTGTFFAEGEDPNQRMHSSAPVLGRSDTLTKKPSRSKLHRSKTDLAPSKRKGERGSSKSSSRSPKPRSKSQSRTSPQTRSKPSSSSRSRSPKMDSSSRKMMDGSSSKSRSRSPTRSPKRMDNSSSSRSLGVPRVRSMNHHNHSSNRSLNLINHSSSRSLMTMDSSSTQGGRSRAMPRSVSSSKLAMPSRGPMSLNTKRMASSSGLVKHEGGKDILQRMANLAAPGSKESEQHQQVPKQRRVQSMDTLQKRSRGGDDGLPGLADMVSSRNVTWAHASSMSMLEPVEESEKEHHNKKRSATKVISKARRRLSHAMPTVRWGAK